MGYQRVLFQPEKRSRKGVGVLEGARSGDLPSLLSTWVLALLASVILISGLSHQNSKFTINDREAELSPRLEKHVRALSDEIGNRSFKNYANLEKAGAYMCQHWSASGLMTHREEFQLDGLPVANFFIEYKGSRRPEEIIIVGAHYDSIGSTCPGANDNGSGVAALLELATMFKSFSPQRTVRFVAFVNEESPYFTTESMGSLVHAGGAKRRNENIIGMLSLETIGYYSNEPKSQKYPFPFNLVYPKRGNFIAFISNRGSKTLLRKVASSFRRNTHFPSLALAVPAFLPGISWSDHWAFWRHGYSAIMITDTAPYRYPHYHLDTDTFDQVDYERLARVVYGLEEVIRELSNETG